MSNGGCLWMSKSGGVFQLLMTSRGQCPRGVCLWMSPPLQEILYPRLCSTYPSSDPPPTWMAGYGPGLHDGRTLKVTRPINEIFTHSVGYRGAVAWNLLPREMKSINTYSKFNSKQKQLLRSKIPLEWPTYTISSCITYNLVVFAYLPLCCYHWMIFILRTCILVTYLSVPYYIPPWIVLSLHCVTMKTGQLCPMLRSINKGTQKKVSAKRNDNTVTRFFK